MIIVVHHFPGNDPIKPLLFGGEMAVCFFFVVSGFLTAYTHRGVPSSYRHYALQKYAKLITGNAIFLLLLLPKAYLGGEEHLTTKFLLDLTLLQCWVPIRDYNLAINGVAWFLSTLLFIYMLAPYIVRWVLNARWRHVGLLALGMAIVVAVAAVSTPAEVSNFWLYMFPPFRLVDFVLGVITYRCYLALSGHKALLRWLPVAEFVLVVIVTCAVWIYFNAGYPQVNHAIVMWLPCSLLILLTALEDQRGGLLGRAMRTRALTRLGDVTGCMFISHLFIIWVYVYVMMKLGIDYHSLWVQVGYVAIVIAFGFVVAPWLHKAESKMASLATRHSK